MSNLNELLEAMRGEGRGRGRRKRDGSGPGCSGKGESVDEAKGSEQIESMIQRVIDDYLGDDVAFRQKIIRDALVQLKDSLGSAFVLANHKARIVKELKTLLATGNSFYNSGVSLANLMADIRRQSRPSGISSLKPSDSFAAGR